MINVVKYKDLGHNDFGWLDARYHFSFARYFNPERMGFGNLRVVNDDIVQPHKGFDTHPHEDMEIITYVRAGAITHEDSKGNKGRTEAGDVQVMSAGTGIRHSEYNHEDVATNLFQIWILPNEKGVQPRWDARTFPKEPVNDALSLLVSGDKADADQGALYIHADAKMYGGRLSAGQNLNHTFNALGYILISEGDVDVNGQRLSKGDAAEIKDLETVSIKAKSDAEVLVLNLAK